MNNFDKFKAKLEERCRNIVQPRLDCAIAGAGIVISNDEREKLLRFLTSEVVVPFSSDDIIRFWPSVHKQMNDGHDKNEIVMQGDDSIVAIHRIDNKGNKVLNICFPSLDARLHVQNIKKSLTVAMRNWVIAIKDLKLRSPIQNDLTPKMENQSDRMYLNEVMERIEGSITFKQILEAIIKVAEKDIHIVPYIIVPYNNGNVRLNYLFKTNEVDYAVAMAAIAENGMCQDLLQDPEQVCRLYGKEMAAIDPDKPSMYMYKGKHGYRPNLYIPEAMFKEWLGE